MLTLALLVSVIFVPVPKVKAAGEVTTVTINRTISRTSKDDILARINEIRLEFYNLNQQYHYVDDYTYTPIKWSSDLEEIAYTRAVEASICWGHTRPNGKSCFSVRSSSGQQSWGEIIASSSNGVNAVNQWYGEKDNYIKVLKREISSSSVVTGHYTQMLYSKYIGVASFGVTAGETSSDAGTSENQIAPTGNVTESVEVLPENVTLDLKKYEYNATWDYGYYTSADNLNLVVGSTNQLKAYFSGWGGADAVGSWSSSNQGVASVDANGLVTALSPGSATITFATGSIIKSISLTVSGATYRNQWVNGYWYNADGSQTYSGVGSWKRNATGWWYEDTAGWYPRNQWQEIDGKWYYFTASGYMDYSEYRGGYWLNADGSWNTAYSCGAWHHNSRGWWYQDGSWYPRNQYLWIDGVQYHFNAQGYWDY